MKGDGVFPSSPEGKVPGRTFTGFVHMPIFKPIPVYREIRYFNYPNLDYSPTSMEGIVMRVLSYQNQLSWVSQEDGSV